MGRPALNLKIPNPQLGNSHQLISLQKPSGLANLQRRRNPQKQPLPLLPPSNHLTRKILQLCHQLQHVCELHLQLHVGGHQKGSDPLSQLCSLYH